MVEIIVAYLMLRLMRELRKHSGTFFAVIGILTMTSIWTYSGFWDASLFLILIEFLIIKGFLTGLETFISMDKRTYAIMCSECDCNHMGTKHNNHIQVV